MSEYKNSEIVMDDEGRQYHIGLKADEISDKIILVGDPKRAELISKNFSKVLFHKQNREFVVYTGIYKDITLTAMSIGIGSPNMEIAVIELCQLKFPLTIIRCGTCGALQDNINIGDLVITSAAVRLENTTSYFVENNYPAVSDHEVLLSLLKAADDNKVNFHVGITATVPGFYGAQCRHIKGFPLKDETLLERLAKQNVKNLEMECSALLTLSNLKGFRAGAVCAVFSSRTKNKFINPGIKEDAEKKAIKIVLNAFENIDKMDKSKKGQYWIPNL